MGRTDIEDALERLDKLTQEEARMATAEGLKATHGIDNKVEDVGDKVEGVHNKIHGVHLTVKDVGDQIAGAPNHLHLVIDTTPNALYDQALRKSVDRSQAMLMT